MSAREGERVSDATSEAGTTTGDTGLAWGTRFEEILVNGKRHARLALDELHGPAWAEGTPRDVAEARAMVREAEPADAAVERANARGVRESRGPAGERLVYLHPFDEKPGAVALAEWSAWWRSAPVPALTTLRTHCEATWARVVLPDSDRAETNVSVWNRYGGTGQMSDRVMWRWAVGRYSDTHPSELAAWIAALVVWGSVLLTPTDGVSADAIDEWHINRAREHAGPYDEARGWCPELWPGTSEAQR